MARTGAKAWITRIVPPISSAASTSGSRACCSWRCAGCGSRCRACLADARPGTRAVRRAAFGIALTIAAARIVGVWELAGVKQPDPTKPIEFKADRPVRDRAASDLSGWILMVFATPVMTTSRAAVCGGQHAVSRSPRFRSKSDRCSSLRRAIRRLPAADAVEADSVVW